MANSHHLQRVSDAMAAIDKVHQDTSVPVETTIDSLEELKEHIETLIESCEAGKDE